MRFSIDQRQAGLAIIATELSASGLVLISALLSTPSPLIIGSASLGLVIFGALGYAIWRGYAWAPAIVVLINTAFITTMLILQTQLTPRFLPSIFVPVMIALLLSGPTLVLIAGLAPLIAANIFLAEMPNNPYRDPIDLIAILVIIIGMVLARVVLSTTLARVAQARDEAEAARAQAINEAAIARAQASELQRQYDEQQRLISLVDTLEVPTISLASGVLLAPIVGNLDSRRAARVTSTLLQAVATQRTRLVILDLAGVRLVDTQVAKAILDLVVAIKLLGCRVTLTGISSAVATTLTHLGIDLGSVVVARDPQDALVNANLELHRAS